jgi:hypothetical protein
MGLTNSSAASPMAFMSDYSINFTVDKVDVSAMGDSNKVYVAGLPDAAGDFSGWYDTASSQTYIAAADGLPRNFYLYPTTANVLQYFFGQVLPDFSAAAGVGAAASVKATWNAAGPVQRYGVGGLTT